MLVDNSIVVLEAIDRRRARGAGPGPRPPIKGAGEVAGAVTAATLTTVAVFFPIVFVQGVAGQLFRDQAITVCLSLPTSLIVSLTLIPALFGLHRPHRLRRAPRDFAGRAGAARERPCPSPSDSPGSSSNRSATGAPCRAASPPSLALPPALPSGRSRPCWSAPRGGSSAGRLSVS